MGPKKEEKGFSRARACPLQLSSYTLFGEEVHNSLLGQGYYKCNEEHKEEKDEEKDMDRGKEKEEKKGLCG